MLSADTPGPAVASVTQGPLSQGLAHPPTLLAILAAVRARSTVTGGGGPQRSPWPWGELCLPTGWLSGAEQSPLGLRALDVQLTKQWLEPCGWGWELGGVTGPPPRRRCALRPPSLLLSHHGGGPGGSHTGTPAPRSTHLFLFWNFSRVSAALLEGHLQPEVIAPPKALFLWSTMDLEAGGYGHNIATQLDPPATARN